MVKLKLILDQHGREDILGDLAPKPDLEWLSLQSIPPLDTDGAWYHAYPLSGGAALVQACAFEVLGDVTEDHVDQICHRGYIDYEGQKIPRGGYNPATAMIDRLVAHGTNHNHFK